MWYWGLIRWRSILQGLLGSLQMAWLHLWISAGNPSDRTDTELRELQRYVGAAWESGWSEIPGEVKCRSAEIIWNLNKAQTFTHFNYQDNLAGKNTVVFLRVWFGELGFTPKANSYTLTAFPLGRTWMDLPARYHATAGLPSLSSQSHLVTSRPFRQVAPFGYTLLAEVPGGGVAIVPLGRRTCWSTRFDYQFWSASIATKKPHLRFCQSPCCQASWWRLEISGNGLEKLHHFMDRRWTAGCCWRC